MEHIYADNTEAYVMNNLVYAEPGNDYLYSDSSYTTMISAADVMDAAKKGMIVAYGSSFYQPVSFALNDTVASITIAVVSLSAFTPMVLYSKEYGT